LAKAGIEHAQALIVCSDDDMLNLETGLRARELKPDIRLVLRIFEEALGRRLSRVFGIYAVYSTSVLAAPAFVGAALKLHLAQLVSIGDKDWTLSRITIEPESRLIDRTIQELNDEDELTVVLHARRDGIDVPPNPENLLHVGDEAVILASSDQLRRLSQLNRSVPLAHGAWT
jgi:voltage-gated potassium channel